MKDYPTQAYLKFFLDYNPETGCLSWRIPVGKRGRRGKIAGCKKGQYRVVILKSRVYTAARIAWVITYGSVNKNMVIKAIDGNPSNLRINNLKEVPKEEGCYRMRKNKDKPSYISYVAAMKAYRVRVIRGGKALDTMYIKDLKSAEIYAEHLRKKYNTGD